MVTSGFVGNTPELRVSLDPEQLDARFDGLHCLAPSVPTVGQNLTPPRLCRPSQAASPPAMT